MLKCSFGRPARPAGEYRAGFSIVVWCGEGWASVWTNATRSGRGHLRHRLHRRRCCSNHRPRRCLSCWVSQDTPVCELAESPPPSPSPSKFPSPQGNAVVCAHQRPKGTVRERRSLFDISEACRRRAGHRSRAASRSRRCLGVLKRTSLEKPGSPRWCTGWRARWLRKLARRRRHGGGPLRRGGIGREDVWMPKM